MNKCSSTPCKNCQEQSVRLEMWDWNNHLFCSNRCAFLYFENVTRKDAAFIEKMKILKDPMTAIYANGGRAARQTLISIAARCPKVVY